MNFNLKSNLEQEVLVKIAASIWDSYGVMDFVSPNCCKVFTHDNVEKFDEIVDGIKIKVSQLPLPAQLQNKLSGLIKPMGAQMLAWLNLHNSRFATTSVKFYWTTHGTINGKRMAEMIVQDESIRERARSKLANVYCLENEYTTWEKYNDRKANDSRMSNESFISDMMFFLRKKFSRLSIQRRRFCIDPTVSPFEHAFRLSALSGNEAATRYLLQKLSSEEKDRTLEETAVHLIKRRCGVAKGFSSFYYRSHFTNVLCVLLCAMSEEQQMKVFNREPLNILLCLLDWPWQCFFPEVLEHVITVLSVKQFYDLLFQIHNKFQQKFDDYDYEHLFKLVWKKGPEDYKEM